jgi:pyruvate,orthophosphate dikinase
MVKWTVPLHAAVGLGRDELGGKAAGLAEMIGAGIPVPPGFCVRTAACEAYHAAEGALPEGLEAELLEAMRELERDTGRTFGGREAPLLVSVRSGAPRSMPGMLDTVLNLGMCAAAVQGLEKDTGNEVFALDTHRRFLEIFANVVVGIPKSTLRAHGRQARKAEGVLEEAAWSAEALRRVITAHRQLLAQHVDSELLDNPWRQLVAAVGAVLKSWHTERAIAYRRRLGIPERPGTGVTVQAMVFGNSGDRSGTGVVFTRNPATGVPEPFGEYLLRAQGEDIVAGTSTPYPLEDLRDALPEVYVELRETIAALERRMRDMQDVEFTIEEGRLYILQTRVAKRTAQAAVRVAVDLAEEGVINRTEAVERVSPAQLDQSQMAQFDAKAKTAAIAQGRRLLHGLAASPGPAIGRIAFDADSLAVLVHTGESVILVLKETSPDDVPAMQSAAGVVTARGGAASHAAVIARELGVPCIVGCADLQIDAPAGVALFGSRVLTPGEEISLDGATGELFAGAIPVDTPTTSPNSASAKLLDWAAVDSKA